jgi:microcystin-dependent protein
LAENPFLWSVTASDNDDADAAVPWPEGMLPGAVNNAARGMMAGVARLIKDLNGTISTTGSANAYLLTSSSAHVALTNGILVSAKASFTNTAAASLNLNSFGAKKILVFASGAEADAAAGQIVSGGTYQFRYDTALDGASGAFLLLNPAVVGVSVGSIKIWPSDTLETGWAWANGQELSQTTYAGLYAILGTTYNTGGETAGFFRVPDLCGRAAFGSDDMGGITAKSRITNAGSSIVGTTLGAAGGVESVTLSTSQIPAHSHTGTTDSGGAHTHTGTTDGQSVDHLHTVTVQSFNILYASGANNITLFGSGSGTTFNTGGTNVGHTHTFTTASGGAHTHTFTTATTGGGALHSNMPPALIVNYVIKAN